jgi:nucleotide-binding universal stress UspA family protein
MLATIICATDLSHRSDRALERAAQLAGQLKLPLHVVSVIDPELPDTLWQAQKQQVRAEIRTALGRVGAPACKHAVVETLVGTPSTEVSVYANALKDCLIVLGVPRESETGHLSFSSYTAGRILRAAVAPVLIVKAHGNMPYRQAVVGIDLSAHSERAALLTTELVAGGEMAMVHAYHVPYKGFLRAEGTREEVEAGQRRKLDTFMSALRAAWSTHGSAPQALSTPTLREGEVHHVLSTEVARCRADLLALGTHGRSGLSRTFFGSVAEDMLREMPCDLLIAVPN